MTGRRRHVIDYSRRICVKCGRQFYTLEDQVKPCAFIFSPRWLPFHRQGQARIRREAARLRRRGLLEDNQEANITRTGHVRPWPEARDNREIRRMLAQIERRQWAELAGGGARGIPSYELGPATRSTSVLRYEDLVALVKSIAPQYPENIRITYRPPAEWGEVRDRTFEISGHRLASIMFDEGWEIVPRKPPIVQS